MRFRRGLLLVAVLTLAAGCGSVEPTTQTSMLRGPTPSSGMTIPQLLVIPTPSASVQPVDPAGSVAPATEETPPASTDAPVSEDPLTDLSDDPEFTDEFGTIEPDPAIEPTAAGSPVAGTDLAALAASFSCLDFVLEVETIPMAASWGTCVLEDQAILLYGFSSDQSASDYASELQSSGVTAEELVQGPDYLIWSTDVGLVATIKAALGAG